jgi:hypothetical protein
LLQEEAAIEGDGVCCAMRKGGGMTGCVVAPLTIGTAPLLLGLAMGGIDRSVFLSESRNIYWHGLTLTPIEDTERFDLIQDRGVERRYFEGCSVKGFELRVMRDEALKLKLDISGESGAATYHGIGGCEREQGERFKGDRVTYRINGKEYGNIYGFTLSAKKDDGIKTEIWIKRVLEKGADLPEIIEEIIIEAQLLRDSYEDSRYGMFRITARRLVLVSDETAVECADSVIGPLRYYASGIVTAEVYSSGEGLTA